MCDFQYVILYKYSMSMGIMWTVRIKIGIGIAIVSQLYFKEEVWTRGLKITLNEHETALNVHELTMM